MNRRNFLKYIGALGLLTGCHSVSSYVLNEECWESENDIKRLRAGSFNSANFRGNTGDFFHCPREKTIKHNMNDTINLVKREGIDILCMNEVDFDSIRTQNINQAKYIARGMCGKYVIEESLFDFFWLGSMLNVGNAVVSKYPLKLNSDHQFGESFSEKWKHRFKGFVDFDVKIGDKSINFVLTHYDHRSMDTKVEESKMIIDHLSKKDRSFVLAGDLNCVPGDKCFDRLIDSGLLHNPYAGITTSLHSTRGIDHILVSKDLRIENYHTVRKKNPENEPSDHVPIIGDIIWE